MSNLLARFAENTFWMARYMERAENLARILDVNESFARDSQGTADWLPIVQLHADEERFFAVHPEATADAVVHYYVLDRDNPSSIVSSVRMARQNARSIRHLISTEMWTHLNVFYKFLTDLTHEALTLSELSRLCATIKENCQSHTGIIEGTFYRDQVWCFYHVGKYVERADQTTRLLDIKYHRLLPVAEGFGSPPDAGQWNALLRSAAGYHAFRRVHPRGMQPANVAGFLLFSPEFPRSVAVCLRHVNELLDEMDSRYGLCTGAAAREALDALRAELDSPTVGDVLQRGLHEHLDWIQRQLIALTDDMGRTFFGHRA